MYFKQMSSRDVHAQPERLNLEDRTNYIAREGVQEETYLRHLLVLKVRISCRLPVKHFKSKMMMRALRQPFEWPAAPGIGPRTWT